jgi:hypothetical protein
MEGDTAAGEEALRCLLERVRRARLHRSRGPFHRLSRLFLSSS